MDVYGEYFQAMAIMELVEDYLTLKGEYNSDGPIVHPTTLSSIMEEGHRMAEQISPDDVLLTIADIAKRLNLTKDAARNLVYRGQLTAFYVGGKRLRIIKRHLAKFLKTQVKRA